MKLEEAFEHIDKKEITKLNDGNAKSIEQLWDKEIKALLLPKSVLKKWFKQIKKYIRYKDAIFIIRTGNSKKNGDPYMLRRGFYTKYKKDKVSFIYDDNDIATYIYKLAYDNEWKPSSKELKIALKNRTIPIKFNKCCKEELAKSAFNLKGRSPKVGDSGYKVSHIFDAGIDYDFGNGCIRNINDICKQYFELGSYSDWKKCKDGYYVRLLPGKIDKAALKFLKAHFLRLVCPLNYILTPKKNLQVNHIKIYKNDVGELKQLQEYARQQFKIIYGKLYDKYTKMLMLPPSNIPATNFNISIDVDYGLNIKQTKTQKSANKSNPKQSHKQKYKFNGKVYLGHRKMVKAVFDQYFLDNPSADYKKMCDDFNMKTKFNNKEIIRIKSSLTNDELNRRVLKNSEKTLSCGTTIMISSQWQKIDMKEFIKLANLLGYKIDLI